MMIYLLILKFLLKIRLLFCEKLSNKNNFYLFIKEDINFFLKNKMDVNQKNKKFYIQQYKHLIHEYPSMTFKPGSKIKKKFKYQNFDDFQKTIVIEPLDLYLEVINKKVSIQSKDSEYIHIQFNIPKTEGYYDCYLVIKNDDDQEVEEIEKYPIEVNT